MYFFFHQTLYESKDNNSKEHSYHKEANTSKIAQTRIESHHILFLRRVKEKKDERKCCLYILSILQTATPDEIHKYHCQESLMQRNQVSFALGKMIDTITFYMEVSF